MDSSILRILDASANRAAEGLRVVEDYARFALEDKFLSRLAKELRHDLAECLRAVPLDHRHAARDTPGDIGTTITTAAETSRGSAEEVCAASMERVKQSLRSIEEYSKTLSQEIAAEVESLRYRFYTLEKAVRRTESNRERLDGVRLYVLIDGQSSAEVFEDCVRRLVAAGCDALQLRDKQLSDRDLVDRARRLVSLTRESPTLAIINDRSDIAAIARADGVHVGQDELSVQDARSIIGPAGIIGVSTHELDQARQAVLDGADYLGAGPTFQSTTKSFDAFPGLDYLRQVASEISLPIFAIGGINSNNLPAVLETGITRVAVSCAVMATEQPLDVVQQLLDLLASSKKTVAH